MKTKAIMFAFIVVGAAALSAATLTWDAWDSDKSEPTLRVSQKSNINTLEAVFRTHFNTPETEPAIVWQSPTTGISHSEKVLFKLMNVRNKKEAEQAREILRREGLRRVYEMCRGITRSDFRWSYGYCTYEDAPELPEG